MDSSEENMQTVVTKLLERIKLLQDFASLYIRRDEVGSDIKELDERLPKIQQQLFECNEMLKTFENSIKTEYKEIVDTMRKQQMAMFYLINEIHKKGLPIPGPTLSYEGTPKQPMSELKSNKNPQLETPRLYLSEYKQSPYVAKIRPMALYFLDFEATFSIQQFNEIPKYLRGRETYDELKHFLHDVIVPCFMEKYQLLHRKRECIRNPQDVELWKMYREQVCYFPREKFITQGDLSRKVDKTVDKKMCTRIAMLRHLGILQEQRKPPVVCYLWIVNNSANNVQ